MDDEKKRKKKKKVVESESVDDILDNAEGFALSNIGVKTCSYGEIGKKGRRLRHKHKLEEWGAFDFFLYAQKKYIAKYGSTWDLYIGGNSLYINRIRDRFYDMFGFCCNLIMRDYIDFFFDNYMDSYIKKSGAFYFSQMLDDWLICEFYDSYDFRASFEQYSGGEKQETSDTVSSKDIRDAFMISDTSLVSNYGVVLAINWLLVNKKMSPVEATKIVLTACTNMHNKGMLDVVKKATESHSPYPSNIPFKNPQLLINKIDDTVKLNVEFNDNSRFSFLQRKGDKKGAQ